MLRKWQSECAEQAIEKYKTGASHYFCQATPGAGKTTLASEIASRLLKANMIDFILCFAPSLSVVDGIKKTFSQKLKCTFSGNLGSIGQSLTYQSLQFLSEEFWLSLKNYRIFVVFDEIHHCSGNTPQNANTWGQQIIAKIQGFAKYTLAMSGTPWRTDLLPIVMARYADPDGKLCVDYQYTLKQAVEDKVCRAPQIVLIDNQELSFDCEIRGQQRYSSIEAFLKETKASYQNIIHNAEAMKFILGLGCQKLISIRKTSPMAGGLVVAASVRHAHAIAKMLIENYQQSVSIVTYRDDEPLNEIEHFRKNNTEWIISVGMISEGTDIPRLQICCHLSSIKTELYFRQVLGRILRINNSINQEAWLYTFAEPSLITYAEEIEKDIPESYQCIQSGPLISQSFNTGQKLPTNQIETNQINKLNISDDFGLKPSKVDYQNILQSAVADFDELVMGEFKQRVISAFL